MRDHGIDDQSHTGAREGLWSPLKKGPVVSEALDPEGPGARQSPWIPWPGAFLALEPLSTGAARGSTAEAPPGSRAAVRPKSPCLS